MSFVDFQRSTINMQVYANFSTYTENFVHRLKLCILETPSQQNTDLSHSIQASVVLTSPNSLTGLLWYIFLSFLFLYSGKNATTTLLCFSLPICPNTIFKFNDEKVRRFFQRACAFLTTLMDAS